MNMIYLVLCEIHVGRIMPWWGGGRLSCYTTYQGSNTGAHNLHMQVFSMVIYRSQDPTNKNKLASKSYISQMGVCYGPLISSFIGTLYLVFYQFTHHTVVIISYDFKKFHNNSVKAERCTSSACLF
jgi:hypothetical protein